MPKLRTIHHWQIARSLFGYSVLSGATAEGKWIRKKLLWQSATNIKGAFVPLFGVTKDGTTTCERIHGGLPHENPYPDLRKPPKSAEDSASVFAELLDG